MANYESELRVILTANAKKFKSEISHATTYAKNAMVTTANTMRGAFVVATTQLGSEFKKIGPIAKKTFSEIMAASKMLAGIGILGGGASLKQFSNFEKGMHQVWTLTSLTKKEFEDLNKQTLNLMQKGGATTEALTKGLYDAVSAGIQVKDSIEFLEIAQDAAIAGATDVAVSVDGLTSVVNAFGKALGSTQIDQTRRAADIFFNTIKYGKTTFAELAPSIGRVASISAQAGIAFDEVGAALASLTLAGIKTDEAITAIRQIMVSVINPTTEALEVAKTLGVEFSATALKANGLQGYLKKLYDASGGNIEIMTKLFGNVRALAGVMGLTGGRMDKYAELQTKIATETGTATEATNKMKETTAFAWDRLVAYVREKAIQLGAGIGDALQPFYDARPEIENLGESFRTFGTTVTRYGVAVFYELKAIILEIIGHIYNFENILVAVGADFTLFGQKIWSGWKTIGLYIKYFFMDIGLSVVETISNMLDNLLMATSETLEKVPGMAEVSASLYSSSISGKIDRNRARQRYEGEKKTAFDANMLERQRNQETYNQVLRNMKTPGISEELFKQSQESKIQASRWWDYSPEKENQKIMAANLGAKEIDEEIKSKTLQLLQDYRMEDAPFVNQFTGQEAYISGGILDAKEIPDPFGRDSKWNIGENYFKDTNVRVQGDRLGKAVNKHKQEVIDEALKTTLNEFGRGQEFEQRRSNFLLEKLIEEIRAQKQEKPKERTNDFKASSKSPEFYRDFCD